MTGTLPLTSRHTYASVQILRGLAASLVVVFHAGVMIRDWFGTEAHLLLNAGAAGVDIFFPISGFVMVVSTSALLNRSDAANIFIQRRIIRIVPIYWIATTLKLLMVLILPSLALHTVLMPWHITASYLFIFALNGQGEPLPLLPVGWTLNFEMFFYAVFAAALYFRAPVVRTVAAVMVVVTLLSAFRTPDWNPALSVLSPIVLEFVAGMVIARLTLNGFSLPVSAAALLGIIGLGALVATDWLPPDVVERWRLIVWGVPGAILLLAAVSLEPLVRQRPWRLPQLVGDASYSIYLFHGFVLPVFGIVVAKLGLGQMLGPVPAFALAIVSGIAAGVIVYLCVEGPITRTLSRLRRPQPAAATPVA